MEWQEISGGWVYLPSQEIKGIIHFLGGAFVATAPQISYRSFLEQIGQEGALRYYHIITPLKKNDHVMYRFDLIGYAYGVGLPLDLTWVGYNYNK